MGNEEFVKVCWSSVEGTNRRGRPLERWEDRVWVYVSERGVRGNGLKWAKRECMDRERWRFLCRGHPLGGCFWGEQGIGPIDWLIDLPFQSGFGHGTARKSSPCARLLSYKWARKSSPCARLLSFKFQLTRQRRWAHFWAHVSCASVTVSPFMGFAPKT